MSLNCFSQTDTVKNKIFSDTTKVVLSKRVAKEIAKDLIKYDGCVEELKLTQDKVKILEYSEYKKDSTIQLLKIKNENNENIILMKDEQLKTSSDLNNHLNHQLKNTKFQNVFYKIGTYIAIVTTSMLIIKWN